MVNFNGNIVKSDVVLTYNNRAFSYGDAIFDTSKFTNNQIEFLEDHYFRLMASMRMLRMEIPDEFTLEFFENEILKTIKAAGFEAPARVKFTVFRVLGGFYNPKSNQINYIVDVSKISTTKIDSYEIDLYKDFYVNSSQLSTIKTTNRIINVVASIYASENNLDNCILLNEAKQVVEVTHANIFLIKGNVISTPSIASGCIKGIIRKKVIEMLLQNGEFILEEKIISPFDLQKADALFITNSIIGIQEVKKYRKKIFNSYLVDKVKSDFDYFIANQ